MLTESLIADFHRDGYLFARGLFSEAEMQSLHRIAKADQQLVAEAYTRLDANGAETKLAVRNELVDSPYSAVVRSERVARTMERLLDDEVYHYHHKMMLKESHIGGAWEWHQDYGYWYNNFLYPDMASCMIFVDRATKENGCLKVLKGSHMVGRIDHGVSADMPEQSADLDRIAELEKRHECVYIEAEPGDALFFHANLLHSSDANNSSDSRRILIVCFNTKSNNPYKEIAHAIYTPCLLYTSDAADE